MDYKEKHEDALERAKECHIDGLALHQPVKEVIEHIFPELKESEDEKIKRCIGMCLTDATEQRFEDFNITLKDCLAWLEKQAEHANFRNKIQIGDKVTRNEDGVLVNLSQFKRMIKQCEQKPNFCHHEVDLSDCSEEYRKAYYDGWNNCNQQHAQLKKPVWSEEDERLMSQIISDLEQCTVPCFPIFIGGIELEINWLKSIKEKMKGE